MIFLLKIQVKSADRFYKVRDDLMKIDFKGVVLYE